jgi:hypothetical protein
MKRTSSSGIATEELAAAFDFSPLTLEFQLSLPAILRIYRNTSGAPSFGNCAPRGN